MKQLDGPIVVMGVSGSGKSTVGAALAQQLAVPFLDADTLHPPANVAKMRAGKPLTDADRYPWLERVGEWLSGHRQSVAACSALRRAYRDQLRKHCAAVQFLHLRGTPELIAARLKTRTGHFMPLTLLQSQVDALEPLDRDERGVAVDLHQNQDVEAIVQTYLASVPSACDDC